VLCGAGRLPRYMLLCYAATVEQLRLFAGEAVCLREERQQRGMPQRRAVGGIRGENGVYVLSSHVHYAAATAVWLQNACVFLSFSATRLRRRKVLSCPTRVLTRRAAARFRERPRPQRQAKSARRGFAAARHQHRRARQSGVRTCMPRRPGAADATKHSWRFDINVRMRVCSCVCHKKKTPWLLAAP